MSPYSDEEYFYKLESILIQSTKYLCQVFKERWKIEIGEDWKEEPDQIQNFLSQHCKNVIDKALPLQKKMLLESPNIENWDMTLMSLILLNFGNVKKYKVQNQAVRQLRDLRNELAHHKSKKITQSEYCEKVKMFKESLQILEVTKREIDILIKQSASNLSLDSIEGVKVLMESAEKLLKIQKFESAIKKYSEAIAVPKLMPINLGEIYEKRAACYLSIIDDQNNSEYTDQAIIDVEQALTLNKSSWNARYLQAQCLRKINDLPDAIRYYEMALAMSPTQKKVKQDLDSCKLLYTTQKYNSNLNQDDLPMNGSEIRNQWETRTGLKLEKKYYTDKEALKTCPVVMGDSLYYGWEGKQDYKKAVKYYVYADKQGNASGCYSLGLCYYHGHGVEQDMEKAVELFKRCASMDSKTITEFESSTPLGFNRSIALAETDLGKCYEEGTGVEKDLEEATSWYLKAMEHGDREAPTILGRIAFFTKGDPKMAEMCWKQGLIFNDVQSAAQLIDYYKSELEPNLAWIMFKIAREMGHSRLLEMTEEQFKQNLMSIQSNRSEVEEDVIGIERQFDLDCKGLTFNERINRTKKYLDKIIHDSEDENDHMSSYQPYVTGLKTVLEEKEYMKSPVRKGLIVQHRERLNKPTDVILLGLRFDEEIFSAKLQQTRAMKLSQKPITLQEMDPTREKIFENMILDLVIIEHPNIYYNSIQLVAEDANGDTTRVYIDNDRNKHLSRKSFEFGCRFAVINPYMWICVKKFINAIRVNEPKCIVYLEKAKDICGFCGEESSTRKCSKCKRLFCSRECQKLDWKMFNHKFTCSSVH